MFKSASLFALVGFVSFASAASNVVLDPKITEPKAGDVWIVGSVQTVTWDTIGIPPSQAGQPSEIVLGTLINGQENLNTSNPLATGFPIGLGAMDVVVPDVTPGSDYIVVLFGDSGNISPQFTISA